MKKVYWEKVYHPKLYIASRQKSNNKKDRMMIDGFSPTGKHMSLPIRSSFFRQHVSNSGTIDFFYTNADQVFVRKIVSSTSSELNMMLLLARISIQGFVRMVMYTRIDNMVEMYFPFNKGGDLFDEFNDFRLPICH